MTNNELPVGWVRCSFGDISSLIRGVSYQKSDLVEPSNMSGVCLLRANNIQNTRIIYDDLIFVKANKVNSEQSLQHGDIFISMSSGSKHLVGKSALFSENSKPTTFGAFCGVIRPSSQINHRFFSYYLQTREYKQTISALSKGSNINNLKREHILNLKISLPPLAEQKRIVGKIEELFAEVDKGINLLKQKQAELKKYRQSVLSAAFSGKLYKTTEWQETNLGAIVSSDKHSIKRGPFGSSLRKEFFVQTGVRVFEQYNPINGDPYWARYFITPEKFEELSAFKAGSGDLLISCSGTLGKILELPNDVQEGIINQALLKIRLNNELILNSFFIHWFNSPRVQRMILDNVRGAAIQNIASVKELKQIAISLPTMSEQEQIVAEIEQRFEKADILEKSIESALESAEKLKQSILKKAFEGKLVPQNPNDEPASVLLERIKSEQPPKKGKRK